MKLIASIFLVSLFLIGHSQSTDLNKVVGINFSAYSTRLESDVSIVLYEPGITDSIDEVTPILYIFGDFLFETFSGSINYLYNELSLIPNCVLIGINEIPDKPIGPYQLDYSNFIATELMDTLSGKYNFSNNGILFGHSRGTRLVGQVLKENTKYINQYIFSAPWFTELQLKELDELLSNRSDKISIFYAQSEEDMARPAIQEANDNLTLILGKHRSVVRAKYQYFDNETHMSIPPLSFYYGIKYLLQ